MTDEQKKWTYYAIIPMVVCVGLAVFFYIGKQNWQIKATKMETEVVRLQGRLEVLAVASTKVVQLNHERDLIIQPVIAKSKALNEKYNKSVDTSVTSDLASLIEQFSRDTESFNRDSL